jgi:methylthioribose-1-phosphate isomerase
VPIEERDPLDVTHIVGPDEAGVSRRIAVTGAVAHNPAFDITPAALVTANVTDRGNLLGAMALRAAMARVADGPGHRPAN